MSSWLACYNDVGLLQASLTREYEGRVISSESALRQCPSTVGLQSDQSYSDDEMSPVSSDATPAAHDPNRNSGYSETQSEERAPYKAGYASDSCETKSSKSGYEWQDMMFKVTPCRWWQLNGRCKYGQDCTFAHGDVELQFWRGTQRLPQPVPRLTPAPASTRKRSRSGASELEMMPSDIGFSHDTVAVTFRDGTPILSTLYDLVCERIKLRDIEKMYVVLFKDAFYSMSNRRLCLYLLCQHLGLITHDTPLKVRLLEILPANFSEKFTTSSQGDWVRVRNDGRICGRVFEETSFGYEELLGSSVWHK